MLESRDICGVNIFRPRDKFEDFVYQYVKDNVFEKFDSGTYTERKKIVQIVNFEFQIYYDLINHNLDKIQPLHFSQFLFQEYENYGRVEELFKAGRLSAANEDFWQKYGGYARRAIKHLLELICIKGNFEKNIDHISIAEQEKSISVMFIAAEEMISLYMRSHLYNAFYEEIELVLDESQFIYFDVKQDAEVRYDVRTIIRESDRYIPSPSILRNRQFHNAILKDGFLETFGADYASILDGLQKLVIRLDDSQRDELDECRIISKNEAIDMLSIILSIENIQAESIIDGFSLTAQKMLDEGRELNRPKQQYRAYKRGFFLISYKDLSYFIFSKRMALECLQILESEVAFKKLPPEWISKPISKGLDVLNNQAGRWFEKVVVKNLLDVGINGVSSVKKLTFKNGKKIHVPPDVGEIDFLGLSKKNDIIIIVEIKQVGFATEPRMYMDDLDKFVTGKNNYSDKFERKFEWIKENYLDVAKYLEEKLSCSTSVRKVAYVMITHYPTFIGPKINKFSCLSITEFMMQHHSDSGWNFSACSVPCLSKF